MVTEPGLWQLGSHAWFQLPDQVCKNPWLFPLRVSFSHVLFTSPIGKIG